MLRKEELRTLIEQDEAEIKKHWNKLFHDTDSKHPASRADKLAQLLSTGIGVFDAAMLGWKLYRKFNKGASFLSLFR